MRKKFPAPPISDPPAPLLAHTETRVSDHPIGESRIFREMMDKLHRYASYDDLPILFEGETGTGPGGHPNSPTCGHPKLPHPW